jgi:Domain of unknown function (DUF6265)
MTIDPLTTMETMTIRHALPPVLVLCAALLAAVPARAQSTPATTASPPPAAPTTEEALAQFAWLAGCWGNKVVDRDYREQWLPPRGGMMLGVSQAVTQGRTLSYEFLRLEMRPDGLYYVAAPVGQKEAAFRLQGKTMDAADEIFTFTATVAGFPERILYRRGSGGWMYAHVEGKVNGEERRNIFPMRRQDCVTGEPIAQ